MKKHFIYFGKLISCIACALILATTSYTKACAAGWAHDGSGWWYDNGDNTYPADSWLLVDGQWYFFNGAGYMCTGWIESAGQWYFCDESGAMISGWREVERNWYWFDQSGAMATDWRKIDGEWYYFDADGAMATNRSMDGGWIDDSGVWNEDEGEYEEESEYEEENSKNNEQTDSSDNETVKETEETAEAVDDSNLSNDENETIQDTNIAVSQNQTMASTLSISDWMEVENEYEMGTTIPITGVISSNYDITYVKLTYHPEYMLTEDYEREFTPNSKTFDLSAVDLSDFDTARIGNTLYNNRFELEARDASGKRIEAKTDYFKIVVTQDTIIDDSDFIKPDDELMQGTDYRIEGVIRSNYPITKVACKLRSKKDGDVILSRISHPNSKEVDLWEEVGSQVDFSKLDPEPYQLVITVDSGDKNIYSIINKRIEIKKAPEIILYSINAGFYDTDDGHQVRTDMDRHFSERILRNADERIVYNYNSVVRPYVLFSSEKSDYEENLRINFVYAHSFGQVTDVDKEKGVVTIRHENGMKTRYSNLDPKNLHVGKGGWVDENTVVGEITKNNPKRLKVELFDKNGGAMDITPYLNADLPE